MDVLVCWWCDTCRCTNCKRASPYAFNRMHVGAGDGADAFMLLAQRGTLHSWKSITDITLLSLSLSLFDRPHFSSFLPLTKDLCLIMFEQKWREMKRKGRLSRSFPGQALCLKPNHHWLAWLFFFFLYFVLFLVFYFFFLLLLAKESVVRSICLYVSAYERNVLTMV